MESYSRSNVYLNSNLKDPKYMFVYLCDLLEKEGFNQEGRLLDIGAATGDFLEYAIGRFKMEKAVGVDFDQELVHAAKNRGLRAEFYKGDANNLSGFEDGVFNAVMLTGVHSIFDEFKFSFGESIRLARKGGLVLITGIFNEFPLDARIHWRYPENQNGDWHPGYNLFSMKSVSSFLESHEKVKSFEFLDFSLPFDLDPKDDPVRSWTYKDSEGTRKLRNGIMPLNFKTLIIRV